MSLMKPVRHDEPHGFTLIELLVVISIIALLISILLPALKAARESGKQVTCASQMRQYTMGALMYTMDNDDWIPAYARDGGSDGRLDYKNTIAPYVGGETHASGDTAAETLAKRMRNEELPVRTCPTGLARTGAHFAGGSGGVVAPFVWVNQYGPGSPPGLRMDDIHRPSDFVMFLDTAAPVMGWDGTTVYTPNIYTFSYDASGDGISDSNVSVFSAYNIPYNGAAMIHQGGLNWSHCDGHVEYVNVKTFQDPDNTAWKDE